MNKKDIKGVIKRFNKHRPKKMSEDYKYPFGISNQVLEKMSEDDLQRLANYVIQQAMLIHFFPHELVYDHFDEDYEEGGQHVFFFWCSK